MEPLGFFSINGTALVTGGDLINGMRGLDPAAALGGEAREELIGSDAESADVAVSSDGIALVVGATLEKGPDLIKEAAVGSRGPAFAGATFVTGAALGEDGETWLVDADSLNETGKGAAGTWINGATLTGAPWVSGKGLFNNELAGDTLALGDTVAPEDTVAGGDKDAWADTEAWEETAAWGGGSPGSVD